MTNLTGRNIYEEHGEGDTSSDVQSKRRQERSFYFTTETVKKIHSKEGVTAMCPVGGHVEIHSKEGVTAICQVGGHVGL